MKTNKFFILTIITIMVLAAGSLWAATLEVPGTYVTIQAAIDAANAGDVINVAAGTYTEIIIINKSLTLQSAAGTWDVPAIEQTKITGESNVWIYSTSNVIIDGFLFDAVTDLGTVYQNNLLVTNSSSVTITDNKFCNMSLLAILIAETIDPIGPTYDPTYAPCSNVTISGNTFDNIYGASTQGDAIYFKSVVTANVTNNDFSNLNYLALNFAGSYSNSDVTITNNTFTDIVSAGINMAKIDGATISNNIMTQCSSTAGKGAIRMYAGIPVNGNASANGVLGTIAISENTISNTNIDGGNAIVVKPGAALQANLVVENNNLAGNVYGVNYTWETGGTTIDATRNYWGDAQGPANTTNPFNTTTTGSAVSDYVDFMPWYATATTTPATENATLKRDDGGDAIFEVFTSDELTNALANCVDGDEIVLGSGTFTGDITIDHDITISAASGAVPIIEGTITIDNSGVTLDGLTIDADTGDPAVIIGSGVDGGTIAINNGSILGDGSSGTVAVDNNSGEDLDLGNNWWGTSSPDFEDLIEPDPSTNPSYSTSAPISIYVSATESLIKDVELQTYSVIANAVEDLYAFTVQLKFLKADFDAPAFPADFTLGSAYTGSANTTFFNYVDDSDVTYYMYTVTGGFNGAVNGVTGSDVVLFTADLTSKLDAENLPGSTVALPNDEVALKDHTNANITCSGTTGKVITIDSSEPTMVTFTEAQNLTLAIDAAKTVTNTWPSVVDTYLGLDYSDNYNLDYVRYLIQLQSVADPTVTGVFSEDVTTGISGTAWNNGGSDWQIPNGVLNAAANDLATGDYDIFFLAVDDAGNFDIWNWEFKIDKTAPDPITWGEDDFCRPTASANNSIALDWTNPTGVENIHIWYYDYANLPDASAYPEFATASAALSSWPDAYDDDGSDGDWTRITDEDTGEDYTYTGMSRGYYYFALYVEDAAGVMSIHPATYGESISYWPGDVEATDGDVDAADIGALSAVWGTTGSGNPACDVGPTTDYGRHSRPTPDDVIDIEDLMIFAMNYDNTDYTVYRSDRLQEPAPIDIELEFEQLEDQLIVALILSENTGFIKGLNIPLSYGSDLVLESVQTGIIWPEGSFIIHTNNDNVVELSGSVLSGNNCIEENGVIATLIFQVIGEETSMELQQMTARTFNNQEIEIMSNPTSNDPNLVIPLKNSLGNNYPNPFNPITMIAYDLKEDTKVNITIYNIRGQKIKTLVNTTMPAGNHQVVWNGKDENNKNVASGIYFYSMKTNDYTKVRKAMLLK